MRPVSRVSTNNKSSQRPVSAQVARRRDLRRQRRQTLLLQLWRFVALLLLSGGFSWILLRHGWTLRSPEAVILTGGAALETNQVIEAAKLRFPSPCWRSVQGSWNNSWSGSYRFTALTCSAGCSPLASSST